MRYKELLEDIWNDESDYESDLDLDSSDRWLKNYTTENLDKWPSKDIINELLSKYPLDKKTKVYRGMNFYTKEKYDEFMNKLKENNYILTTNRISSWAPNEQTAEQFAYVQPTYFPTPELMQYYSKAQQEGEKVVGYRGIIMSTELDIGQGIDVRKSKYGKEPEIISIPGKYKVTVKEIKTFKDRIQDNDTNYSQIILDMTKEEINTDSDISKFFDYVLKHAEPDEISDEAKHHLFLLFNYAQKYNSEHRPASNGFIGIEEEIQFYYRSSVYKLYNKGFILERDALTLKKEGIEILKSFMEVAIKHPEAKLRTNDLRMLVNFCDFEDEWKKFIKMYGKQYDKRNDTIRDINKITDPREKEKAIDDYKNDIMKIIGNITQL